MAKYKGKSVTLNKPRRIAKGETSYGKKKSVVYVTDGDRVKRVTFGDPNMKIKKNQKVLDENIPIYEIEPSIELAFKIAKAAGALRELGKYDDRYGPISNDHKLLVAKHKGNYKKYRKAVKKGKEK